MYSAFNKKEVKHIRLLFAMERGGKRLQAKAITDAGDTDDEGRDKTRFAGDGGGDADFRFDWLVCADVRSAGD
ncbi:hypothetical protein GGER_15550 [Serratia rubidaea]